MAKKKGKKRARLRLEDLHLEPWQRAEIEKQLGRAIGPGGAGGGDGERDVVGLEVAVDDPLTDRDLKPAKSSGVERRYQRHLDALRVSGEVQGFLAQPPAIELAHDCTYTADWLVTYADGTRAYVETKGAKGSRPFFHDDGARVKTKVAARILAARGEKLILAWPAEAGGWCHEEVPTDRMHARRVAFLKRVRRGDGCWLWLGHIKKTGYGSASWGDSVWQAHRVSYALFVGPIPDGMNVLHRCDVRACVRPDHLFTGTQQDNVDDMHAKGRNGQPKGVASGRAKLTPDDVREIRRRSSESLSAIARDLGVTSASVSQVRRGKTWRHVPHEAAR